MSDPFQRIGSFYNSDIKLISPGLICSLPGRKVIFSKAPRNVFPVISIFFIPSDVSR